METVQYVTYRYRAQAALWWPAAGEDININGLPAKPGKAIQLEMKTTTVTGKAFQDVFVDLGQLWEYRQLPLGHQPFYVFPWPDWRGELAAVASADGRVVTELAFSRSGGRWWFADWMVVLTSGQVAAVLRSELAAHGRRTRGKKARLVRFDLRKSTTDPEITWGSAAAPPPAIRWLDFWPALEQCGEAGWPQLIRLPRRIIRSRAAILPARAVAGLLRQSADLLASGQWDAGEPLVTLEPDEDGNYRVTSALDDEFAGSRDVQTAPAAAGGDADNRLVIFLDARALAGG
jgi:hypothetical protein